MLQIALLAAALGAGVLLAVQTSVNLQLNRAVGTPYGASFLQLGVATVLLLVVAIAVGAVGAVGNIAGVEWWHLLGGLASPLYITSGILLFPRLGALASVGLFVTGQMFASLSLDLFGLIGLRSTSLTVGIVIGAASVLAGITLIIRGQATQRGGSVTAPPVTTSGPVGTLTSTARTSRRVATVGWLVLGIVAGGVLPIQGAVNAKLRTDLDAPIAVGLISFVVATFTIGVVLFIMLALRKTPTPQLRSLPTMPWWGWLGGACAAIYVTATFLLLPEIGAATTIALTVTGQQVASAIIDHFGLFRLPRRLLTTRRTAGLALLVVGSILIQLS